MPEFVFYLRNQEGQIERLGNMITVTSESILGSYLYVEVLTDFPESVVFWANEKGVSVWVESPLMH